MISTVKYDINIEKAIKWKILNRDMKQFIVLLRKSKNSEKFTKCQNEITVVRFCDFILYKYKMNFDLDNVSVFSKISQYIKLRVDIM